MRANVWDAVEFTPDADGEPEIRVRGTLDLAAQIVSGIAPRIPPARALLALGITSTSKALKVEPYRNLSTPFSYRMLRTSVAQFPPRGVLRIEDEDIAYEYTDWDTQEFLGLQRGFGRSTGVHTAAAPHLPGVEVFDAGYEYAFFNAQLTAFDYLWKTEGAQTLSFSNTAVGAQAAYQGTGDLRKMVRDVMGYYAPGSRPANIV